MSNHGDIEFAGGTASSLRSLSQGLTYEGLLDGAPTAEMTKRQIARVRERYRGADRGHDALVLEPPLKPLRDGAPGLASNRCLLPRVHCRAWFSRWSAANGDWGEQSHLTLVWWQDDWAFPIDQEVLAQVRTIPWADVAYDWSD